MLAVDRYLLGESLADLRRALIISRDRWLRRWSGFRDVLTRRQEEASVLAEDLGFSECLIQGWQDLASRLEDTQTVRDRLAESVPLAPAPIGKIQQLKDQLGLDHFEGRSWPGWHHHVTMIMMAFDFLTLETLRAKTLLGGPSREYNGRS